MPLVWKTARFELALDRPLVMGIVNVTPDSFSDGGLHAEAAQAIAHAQTLIEQGADVLDVGGESTRPGSPRLTPQQEWTRIGPVLREVVRWNVPVSVDTYHPQTMQRAIDLGVDVINDIFALRQPGAVDVVARSAVGVCLMHMQAEPGTMQLAPHYDDVGAEVRTFLHDRAAALRSSGIAASRIALDPGFGFGKSLEHNLQLAHGLGALATEEYPLLVGVSRKSMIGALTGRDVSQRLAGSLAAALACVAAGAHIVRVHDVAATVDAIKVWRAMRG
jgi:dihydropteroate synthase